jgi:DnaJ-class molecular chaperone
MRDMVNFNEIDEARKLLGLGEAATMKEIKTTYRRLARCHHPDKNDSASEKSNEMMKKLNQAYTVLMDYCSEYIYSFRREDVARVYPEEEDYKKWRENWPF